MSFVGFGNAISNDGKRATRWLTPPYIVESLGVFDLDPCGAPNHSLASVTYQIDEGQDGLMLPWFGRVWLNPPYGKEAAPFMEKMAIHGSGTAFLFARTETNLFFDYVWPYATAMKFVKGRVKFLKPDLTPGAEAANAPSVLIAYGEKDAQALEQSNIRGKFVRLENNNVTN